MEKTKISFANDKIAFIKGNRDIIANKGLKESIRVIGVFTPIQVVEYGKIKQSGIVLVNFLTKEDIASPSDDTYVVVDGQHRLCYAYELYQENLKNGGTIEDSIPVNILKAKDFKDVHPLTMIAILNSTSKSWTSSNFIESAHTRKEDDELLNVFNTFRGLGFSISVISMFVFFKGKELTPASLIDYVEGRVNFENANPMRALEIFSLLRKVGFSISFIKKRYLIEMIVKQYRASIDKYNTLIKDISILDAYTVGQIEAMNAFDFSCDKVLAVIKDYARKHLDKPERQACTIDESAERYETNKDFVRIELQTHLNCMKKKYSRKQATSSPQNSISLGDEDVGKTTKYKIEDVR